MLARLAALSRLVILAADHQYLAALVRIIANRMVRRAQADVHPFGHTSIETTAEHVGALRRHRREIDVRVVVGEVRADDARLRPDLSATGLNGAGLIVFDVEGARLFKDVASVAGYFLCQREQVLARVKLRLIVKADGPPDLERQLRGFDQRGGKTELCRRLSFPLDLFKLVIEKRVGVGTGAAKVAVDLVLADERGDSFFGRLLRLAEEARFLFAELLDQMIVDQVMQRSDLRGRVARDALNDATGFDDGDAQALLLQEKGCADARNPSAEDGHVHVDVVRQSGVIGDRKSGVEG